MKKIVWSAIVVAVLICATIISGVIGNLNSTLGFGLGAVALVTLLTV